MCAAMGVHLSHAQHTLGISGGLGSSNVRFYPIQETKSVIGGTNFGLSWRYYSLPRFVGAVGVDLEYMQRGFKYGYSYKSSIDEQSGKEVRNYSYFTRDFNTIMLPIVWQPHAYLAKNHLRLYLEAALTLSYNFGGDWKYDDGRQGSYDWRIERDNRFSYGLAGGGGFALLFGRYEFGLRARYYFGYGDLMRNRNKYYNNATDGLENPFKLTPLRSPTDNINLSVTMAYRLGKAGFASWYYKPNREKRQRDFIYLQSTSSSSTQNRPR